jgi:hypothetical protein
MSEDNDDNDDLCDLMDEIHKRNRYFRENGNNFIQTRENENNFLFQIFNLKMIHKVKKNISFIRNLVKSNKRN